MELHPSLGEASNCPLQRRAPTFANNNALGEETSRRLPSGGRVVAAPLRTPPHPVCSVSSFGTTFPSPTPRPGDAKRSPESAVGAAFSLSGESRRLAASPSPHPRTLCPGSGSGPLSGPRRPRRGCPRRQVPSLSGPGPQPLPPWAPQPLRPVLTPHPVHVGRHGRSRRRLRTHKGVRKAHWGRDRLEEKPRARGWRFAKVSVGPAQQAPLPPQPSRFIPARAVAAAVTASRPRRRGRRQSARLLPERARLPQDRSQAPAPLNFAEPHQIWGSAGRGVSLPARFGVRLLPEHLRPIRRTRPGDRLRSESETPQLGHFRKRFGSLRPTAARRSVISAAARPLLRGRMQSWA